MKVLNALQDVAQDFSRDLFTERLRLGNHVIKLTTSHILHNDVGLRLPLKDVMRLDDVLMFNSSQNFYLISVQKPSLSNVPYYFDCHRLRVLPHPALSHYGECTVTNLVPKFIELLNSSERVRK
eukprot:CAMPEP_0184754064 /NCGR_PEP_ID=MMETSP0315-20130426/44428_1 /TAXON_ID=101924 /ORGANISM="Rhodosorus marinus, Strain UTEX LB 2760" /LENGTH=123 /DNA_ID=CAMNT_0027233465 /DNA_START=755 /DNA_END=1126 /DNA_ORIENTATION=-